MLDTMLTEKKSGSMCVMFAANNAMNGMVDELLTVRDMLDGIDRVVEEWKAGASWGSFTFSKSELGNRHGNWTMDVLQSVLFNKYNKQLVKDRIYGRIQGKGKLLALIFSFTGHDLITVQ
jgi:hypothetical protein